MPKSGKIGKAFSQIALLLLLLPAAGAPACNRAGVGRGAGDGETAPKEPTVTILKDEGAGVRVKVELARTPEEKATGLMYRDKLEKGTGMLFLFEEESVQSFWMKNTLIPLDMIFIGSDLRIAGIVENAEPLTLTPRRVEEPSQYVLEVEGGFCSAFGIKPGMKVSFSGFKP
jgi:uncharacterized membrane protein (UPF0127 family)